MSEITSLDIYIDPQIEVAVSLGFQIVRREPSGYERCLCNINIGEYEFSPGQNFSINGLGLTYRYSNGQLFFWTTERAYEPNDMLKIGVNEFTFYMRKEI